MKFYLNFKTIFVILLGGVGDYFIQCCGAATILGGSGSRQKKAAPAPYIDSFHFDLSKK